MISSEFTRKADHDARFVMVISILVLLATAGVFYAMILIRILYQAKTAGCVGFPADAVYLVFGKELQADQPDPEYIQRLDRLLACGFNNAILMG
ncbi:MAG: hypothetical protein ACRERS_10550, partial [Methylococcales bacterium]